jgi:hypothetical protein
VFALAHRDVADSDRHIILGFEQRVQHVAYPWRERPQT